MFKHKRSVYIIAFSLLGLLTMQGMWLFYAIRQETRFLDANTRRAALESLASVEQAEDSKFLIKSLDTVLPFKDIEKEFETKLPARKKVQKSEVKVFVNNGEKRVIIRNTEDHSHGTAAYAFSTGDSSTSEVRIIKSFTEDNDGKHKKAIGKLKNYEQLLKKIVYQSQPKNLKIEERVNFTELTKNLNENLQTRGIDLKPEVAIIDKEGKIVFKTPGYVPAATIVIPMFPKDIVSQGYTFNLVYPSTISYTFKKAIGVIVMSLFVTLLLVTVILLLYKKMLTEQKLNQYKSDFINNLTHELKTPLATISLANSNINAAAKYSNQENIKQYTGIIDEESKKLNGHIEKVFELSLLEKEKQIFHTEVLNVKDVIAECLADNKALLNSGNVFCEFFPGNTDCFVRADKFHLQNVVSNLLENAIKYSGGKAQVNISLKNEGDKIRISVKDKGIGISKEHQRYIFDKFFRVTDKDLHTTKGFGIGLSYGKQTVELFGGTVSVESEPGKGSEFIITLPNAKS